MMSRTQKFGLKWEQWALNELKARGYSEARLVSNYFASVDILLGTLPIEVKAATPRDHYSGKVWRRRWQFDVSRLPQAVDSLVILIALDHGQVYPFIVPSWLIGLRHNVHLTSHPEKYRGYFARFLNNWEWVNVALAIRAKYAGQIFLPLGTGDSYKNNPNGGILRIDAPIRVALSPSPLLQGA